MTRPSHEVLVAFALGTLAEPVRAELERRIADSAAIQRELAELRALLGSLPLQLTPLPAASGRDALLAALRSPARFTPFARDLARHFDLPLTQTQGLLAEIDDAARWEAGPLPGIQLLHVEGGPKLKGADAGFVRLPRGLRIPRHRHLGPETSYVLEGSIRDSAGRVWIPGEAIAMAPDSEHALRADLETGALVAVVMNGAAPVGTAV